MNALDLRQAMTAALADEPVGGPDPVTALQSGKRLRSHRRWRTSIAVVAAVSVLIAIAAVGVRYSAPKPRPAHPPTAVHGNGPIDIVTGGVVHAISVRTGKLIPDATVGPHPATHAISWSPDGTRLAYLGPAAYAAPDDEAVVVLTEKTGVSRVLGRCACTSLAWAPDGTRIAVSNGHLLQLWNPAGGPPTTIANLSGTIGQPTWSPDSKRLAFAWDTGRISRELRGGYQITDNVLDVINADGSHRRTLRGPNPLPYWPTWSPDGSKIAFLQTRLIPHRFGNLPGYAVSVMVINPDGSAPITLAHAGTCLCFNLRPAGPAWSPDGTLLAMSDVPRAGLFVMKADGTGQRRLTKEWVEETPAWQPVPSTRAPAASP